MNASCQAPCPTRKFDPRKCRSKRYDSVSHAAKAVLSIGEQGWVHPGGQPINISANRGFKTRLSVCPSGVVASGWWVDAIVCRLSPPVPCDPGPVPLLVFGVGHWLLTCECSVSVVPRCRPESCSALGVAQNRACWSSAISSLRFPPRLRNESVPGVCQRLHASALKSFPCFPFLVDGGNVVVLFAISDDVGVGQAEPALAAVRGARFLRAEYVPFAIEPEGDQGTEDGIEESAPVSGNDAWYVLEKDIARLNLGDDSPDIAPDESVVVHALSLSGEADRLAGETGSDEIHAATPRSAIEGRNVIPDRSVIQAAVFDPRGDDGCGELVPFDVADRADIGCESQSEVKSAHAGAQADGT